MTTETPPDEVLIEAAKLSETWCRSIEWLRELYGVSGSFRALCDMIEQNKSLAAENERLREALRVLRDLPIVENDNANTLHLDGVAHTGPVVDWLFHFVRKIKKVSDAALEKQP
jgi:regulator of replication initiation timing